MAGVFTLRFGVIYGVILSVIDLNGSKGRKLRVNVLVAFPQLFQLGSGSDICKDDAGVFLTLHGKRQLFQPLHKGRIRTELMGLAVCDAGNSRNIPRLLQVNLKSEAQTTHYY